MFYYYQMVSNQPLLIITIFFKALEQLERLELRISYLLQAVCHPIQATFFLHVLDRFDFVPPCLSDIYGDLLHQVSLTSGMHRIDIITKLR